MGRPWMRFFVSDFLSDPHLRLCSLAARGLWTECLGIMIDAVPFGHLLINGRVLTDEQLGRIAGAQKDEISTLLTELVDAGAFRKSDDGSVFSPLLIEWASRPLRLPVHEWERLRSAVFERDSYTCRYCGATGVALDCDHVIPVSRGGSNDIENLATACFRCNRSKGAKLLSEWINRA